MPHLIVEYSANIEGDVDMPRLLSAIHAAALETDVFPLGGVRVRAERRDLYAIADQHRDNAFIHVQARIGIGRAPEVRQKAAEHIFAAVKSETARAFARRPMGLSLVVVEIDPVGSLKHNNLHEAVEARRKGSAA
jgi:5-carboxymethyl-2-hydroxymuconate isomerase